MRRLLAAGVMASLFVVVGPAGEAVACSCATSDPATQLEQSDAAFVGKLIERPTEPNEDFTGIWIFEVEQWVKGEMGDKVGVHAGLDGAGCGFEMTEGGRAGVFLYNDNGRPSGGLCSVTSPEAMLAATEPLIFDGVGPPVFLVAADTGRSRLATLDARGRLLAAVADERFVWSVSVCPGEELIVDVIEGEVAVRDINLEEVRLVDSPLGEPQQVWCLDAGAERILAQVESNSGAGSTLVIIAEGEPLPAGEAYLMDVSPTHLVFVTYPTNGSLDVLDLASGQRSSLGNAPNAGTLAFSPNGQKLMVSETTFHDNGGYETVVTVYDAASKELIWRSQPLADASIYDWVDDHRLWGDSYPVDAEPPSGLIVDTRDGTTTELRPAGWGYQTVGDALLSVHERTLLVTSPDGITAAVATLPTPMHRLVAVLDKEANLSVPDTTTTTTNSGEATATSSPEVPTEPSFPTAVTAAALGGVALILAVGWRAIRRQAPLK